MAGIARRGLIGGALAVGPLAAGRAWAQAPAPNPKVTITTDHGAFTAEIFELTSST